MGEWYDKAWADAVDAAEELKDEIIEAIIDNQGGAPTQITDRQYGESFHHERHVDRSYRLLEAAEVLNDLDEYEEGDAGIWEGQAPRDAIGTMAAYTYGNAVYSMFEDVLEDVNSAIETAVGNDLFWDLESEMGAGGKRKRRGVKEWRPGISPTTQEEMEAEEEAFQKRLKENVTRIVSQAIEIQKRR